MRHSSFFLLLALLAIGGCAASTPTPAPAPAGPAMINASDKPAIDAANPTVVVTGVVDKVTVGDEVITINFKDTADSQFYAVVLQSGRDAVLAGFNGDIAKAVTGKTVHVTGKIVLYRGRPEIVISKPEQLTIVQ